jgi:hypothetical protein
MAIHDGYKLEASGYIKLADHSGPYSISSSGSAYLLGGGSSSGSWSGDENLSIVISDTEPVDPTLNQLWFDTSG